MWEHCEQSGYLWSTYTSIPAYNSVIHIILFVIYYASVNEKIYYFSYER